MNSSIVFVLFGSILLNFTSANSFESKNATFEYVMSSNLTNGQHSNKLTCSTDSDCQQIAGPNSRCYYYQV